MATPDPERSPDFVPIEWTSNHYEGPPRDYVARYAERERHSIRQLCPGAEVPDMPHYLDNKTLNLWILNGKVPRYIPDMVMDEEVMCRLLAPFDEMSWRMLKDNTSDHDHPLWLEGGWKLWTGNTLTVADIDADWRSDQDALWATVYRQTLERMKYGGLGIEEFAAEGNGLDEVTGAPLGKPHKVDGRVLDLLYQGIEQKPARILGTRPRLPKAAELLFVVNASGQPEKPARELCRDFIPMLDSTGLLSLRHDGVSAKLVPIRTTNRLSGGIRPVWDMPTVLRAS